MGNTRRCIKCRCAGRCRSCSICELERQKAAGNAQCMVPSGVVGKGRQVQNTGRPIQCVCVNGGMVETGGKGRKGRSVGGNTVSTSSVCTSSVGNELTCVCPSAVETLVVVKSSAAW